MCIRDRDGSEGHPRAYGLMHEFRMLLTRALRLHLIHRGAVRLHLRIAVRVARLGGNSPALRLFPLQSVSLLLEVLRVAHGTLLRVLYLYSLEQGYDAPIRSCAGQVLSRGVELRVGSPLRLLCIRLPYSPQPPSV